jgi:hypothetical protein
MRARVPRANIHAGFRSSLKAQSNIAAQRAYPTSNIHFIILMIATIVTIANSLMQG